jgi:hypothetical protein
MTIFNWLEEITVKKTPPNDFSQQDWDDWNKYIKSQNKKDSKELAKIIANLLLIGSDEASSYINILGKDKITKILSDLGYDKKQLKQLIKTI